MRTDVGFSPWTRRIPGDTVFRDGTSAHQQWPEEGDPDPEFSPYLIDIEAGATTIVLATSGASRPPLPATGTSTAPLLIWGAIRELLALMTSRMPAERGALLPSVNFRDLKNAQAPSKTTHRPPRSRGRP